MSADYARSKLHRRFASAAGVSRLAGSAPDRSRSLLTEVVTTERAIRHALVPFVRDALAGGVVVGCELLPGVGRYVLGRRRQLEELVALAASEGVAPGRPGEVWVRIARQSSGFDPTDIVIVSVAIHHGQAVEGVTCVEASLPIAEGDDAGDAKVLAGKRLLVVVPTAHGARVCMAAARRFGAGVTSGLDGAEAEARLRLAYRGGERFDAVYVDESTSGAEALLAAARDDASLGAPFRLIASADEDASAWAERGAESVLSKPMLPFELCDALAEAMISASSEPESSSANTCVPPPARRRTSGMRSLGLAAALAAIAVRPGRTR